MGAQIPALSLLAKEITYKGSFRYGVRQDPRPLCLSGITPGLGLAKPRLSLLLQPGDYQLAMALVRQGKVDLAPLVTHRYSFDEAARAFQVVHKGKSEDGRPVIKAVISGPDDEPSDLL